MILIALIAVSCAVYFSMRYYTDLSTIRSYLKKMIMHFLKSTA